MINWAAPGALFNPILATPPLGPLELLAGPLGLIAFVPLVPLVRLAARARRRTALVAGGLVWLVVTLGLPSAVGLLVWVAAGSGWVWGLAALRRWGRVSAGATIALVWIGLHLLFLPFWWFPQEWTYGWQPARPSVLHALGFSYFLLRLVAWGVDAARSPHDARRPADTLCWLLYPPCMRNGPVLLRQEFLERLDAWEPSRAAPSKQVAKRISSGMLGLLALAVAFANTPRAAPGVANFFDAPDAFTTVDLIRVFYLIPIQAYLFLWSYNEFAAGLALWLGIRVDDNFDWLPRATSVRDFWHRWHVTVGRWLRNYVYIPLGGNRGVVPAHYAAVFGYCALWHGPSWSFVAWGATQVLALTLQREWDRLRARRGGRNRSAGPVWTGLCWLITMHYQIATIVVFADFDHCGVRFFRELLRRVLALTG